MQAVRRAVTIAFYHAPAEPRLLETVGSLDSSLDWTGLDWFFLIPEDRRPKPETPLHAMLFCPVQFSRCHALSH